VSGVTFDETTDKRAFFDRLVLSIWGERKELEDELVKNRPIGGKDRAYARSQRGKLPSGNPYELRYGLSRGMKFMPPMMLILRSEASPLTVMDTISAVRALCNDVTRVAVSEAEVSFDLTGVSVDYFRQRILSSARTFTQLRDDQGRQTLYARVRRAEWQARIYAKSPTITRFEFVLRSKQLRDTGIDTPLDLGYVRHLPLSSLVSLRELDETVFNKLVAQLPELQARVVQDFRRKLPLQVFLREMRDTLKLPESAFLKPEVAKRMEKMQRRLLFDPYFPGTALRKRTRPR
jgi:hypothetical protein